MTWAVVLYPAWDDWSEADPTVRDSIQGWLQSWVPEGPPPDAEQVDRLLETLGGVELQYFSVVHSVTGVTVTYIVGASGELDYVALISIRSRRQGRG